MLEEAKKRDHRKLGKDLEIFVFDDEVGPGLPLWLPNGGIMIEELETLAKVMELKAGYQRVRTPHLAKEDLFLHSGHLPYYAESMYPPMELEGVRYYVKPMNCPMHHKIFGSRPRSCTRAAAAAGRIRHMLSVRKERRAVRLAAGALDADERRAHLLRRGAVRAGVHGCRRAIPVVFQAVRHREVRHAVQHASQKGLGKKYVDNERLWLKTEEMVRRAMSNGGVPFVEVADEAAFYGPKIDVQVWSAIGKEFTLATNQVDFAQPRSLQPDLYEPGGRGRDAAVHPSCAAQHARAAIGFLIEHYAGNFPVWLAPNRCVSSRSPMRHNDYAAGIAERLLGAGVHARADNNAERMNAKIRAAQLMKVPYMPVVGDQEAAAGTVSLRKRDGSRLDNLPLDQFVAS